MIHAFELKKGDLIPLPLAPAGIGWPALFSPNRHEEMGPCQIIALNEGALDGIRVAKLKWAKK